MTRLPADDAVAEVLLKPCEGQFGRVRACPILLEPPAALIAITGSAIGSPEPLQELVQDADVAVGCDCGRRAIAGLEPKWSDDAAGAHGTPDGDPGGGGAEPLEVGRKVAQSGPRSCSSVRLCTLTVHMLLGRNVSCLL